MKKNEILEDFFSEGMKKKHKNGEGIRYRVKKKSRPELFFQKCCVIDVFFFFSETLSPLDANLPYADDFHQDVGEEGNNSVAVNEPLEFNNLSSNRIQDTSKSSAAASAAAAQTPNSTNAESEYNRILSEINNKQQEEEEINAILQDWKLLAQKVDYILFWVFLALTTISSCIFIFILPYFKRGKLL